MREAIRPVAEGGHHEELLQRRIHVAREAIRGHQRSSEVITMKSCCSVAFM
jgi:hypothetical protein